MIWKSVESLNDFGQIKKQGHVQADSYKAQ